MVPKFVHAGGRGGPLRPSGSSTVPTHVKPYRVGSGALRVVVSVLAQLQILLCLPCAHAHVDTFFTLSELFSVLQGALMCILGTMIAAVLPILAYIFVSLTYKNHGPDSLLSLLLAGVRGLVR